MSKAPEIYGILQTTGLKDTICQFALCQAAHETAGFTSFIFIQNNNCFGMKYAGQVNATGEKNGYANYEDLNHSVADFAAWYTRHRSILQLPLIVNSLEKYVEFLKNNDYFEAEESVYLKGCERYYKILFG